MNSNLEWFESKLDLKLKEVIKETMDVISQKNISIKKAKLINNVLTVITEDGKILSKTNATEDDYEKLETCFTLQDLESVMMSESLKEIIGNHQKEVIKIDIIKNDIELLKTLSDFTFEENHVYLTGTSRTLPQLLIEKFGSIAQKAKEESTNKSYSSLQAYLDNDIEYLAHKNFFYWCCLNPRAEVANSLYDFLHRNNFKITKQGFFVALRNVVTLHSSQELINFVSNTYNKVKAVWKKTPEEYTVFLQGESYKLVHNTNLTDVKDISSNICTDCDGEGDVFDDSSWEENKKITCENCKGTGEVEEYDIKHSYDVDHGMLVGNLLYLYIDLPNREENRYTDNWTKTFDIRIGQVVNMPKEEADWSTQDCARKGLHFAGHTSPYVLCGDTSVFTLINPRKVVGIGSEKGRCYEYLPFMTTSVEEADEIMNSNSFDFLQIDEQYAITELDSLADRVKEGFTVEANKYDFNIPSISSLEINTIANNLNNIKSIVDNRIINV
jgi:hypothetical protein